MADSNHAPLESKEDTTDAANAQPIWSREENLPPKPDQLPAPYGVIDHAGNVYPAHTEHEQLESILQKGVVPKYLWSPHSQHLMLPEEMKQLRPAITERNHKWAQYLFKEGRNRSIVIGIGILYFFFQSYRKTGDFIESIQNFYVGIGVIILLIVGLVPLYEGWKRLRKKSPSMHGEEWNEIIATSRFEQ